MATQTTVSPSVQTRALITSYIDALSTRNFSLLASHFSPDATWWVSGTAPHVPYGGHALASERAPQLGGMFDRFSSFRFTIRNLIVSEDGQSAALEGSPEGEGWMEGVGGVSYRNDVVMVFKVDVEGNKILEKREYLDHDAVKDSFVGDREAEGGKDGGE